MTRYYYYTNAFLVVSCAKKCARRIPSDKSIKNLLAGFEHFQASRSCHPHKVRLETRNY